MSLLSPRDVVFTPWNHCRGGGFKNANSQDPQGQGSESPGQWWGSGTGVYQLSGCFYTPSVDTGEPYPRADLRGTAGHSVNKEAEWKKTIKLTMYSMCNYACLQSRGAPV